MSTQEIDRQAIMSRALRHGFTLRQQPGGEMDLNEYVYAFAQEVFEAGRKAERDALRPVCAEAYQMADALGASVEAPQIDREKVRDAIAQALGCMIYCCTRSWEAWNVGTMRRDDFILASEDDCILDELTAAVISAIEAKPESGSAS